MATRIAVALLTWFLFQPRAAAHPEATPARTNRYLQITLLEGRVRLAYTLLVGERPAFFLRQSADTNRDGRLDAAERTRLSETLAAAIARTLAVTLDGVPVPVRFSERDLTGDDGVSARALGADLFAHLEAGSGTHVLLVHDRYEPRDEGESEVTFDAAPGVDLATFTGREGTRPGGPRFAWPGPRRSDSEDRTVGARFAQPRRPRYAFYAITGSSCGLVSGLVLLARRRRRRGQRSMKG